MVNDAFAQAFVVGFFLFYALIFVLLLQWTVRGGLARRKPGTSEGGEAESRLQAQPAPRLAATQNTPLAPGRLASLQSSIL